MSLLAPRTFGEIFRSARLEKKMTLRAAAKALKMDAGNLSKLERGLLPPPRKDWEIQRMFFAIGARGHADFAIDMAFSFHQGALQREFFSCR